jgi:hypothetical protein
LRASSLASLKKTTAFIARSCRSKQSRRSHINATSIC